MKLKNKKTGEIVSLEGELLFDNEVMLLKHYASLAELNAEWEDVPEEPKEYWYWCISQWGDIVKRRKLIPIHDEDKEAEHKEIGNYFETKEEAELAVCKLKAWKRLKDKGFKFYDWKDEPTYRVVFEWNENIKVQEVQDDLDLLFGGEE